MKDSRDLELISILCKTVMVTLMTLVYQTTLPISDIMCIELVSFMTAKSQAILKQVGSPLSIFQKLT